MISKDHVFHYYFRHGERVVVFNCSKTMLLNIVYQHQMGVIACLINIISFGTRFVPIVFEPCVKYN